MGTAAKRSHGGVGGAPQKPVHGGALVSLVPLTLHRREFLAITQLFLDYAGLRFDEAYHKTLERRLGERVETLGLGGFEEYYRLLRAGRNGNQELALALDAVTTSETYFMRQAYQLESFELELLPLLRERNARERRLTIWSAGCSTGEEVYTLAIIIARCGLFEGWDVKVIGSDLSHARVAFAREGQYGDGSFRSMSQLVRDRYFSPVVEKAAGGGRWRVKDDVRRPCSFTQLNLMDARESSMIGRVDVVFCRNVLIYLGAAARERVIENFRTRLVNGGYLLLGHSESLLNISTAFELVHLKRDLVYQKPSSSLREVST